MRNLILPALLRLCGAASSLVAMACSASDETGPSARNPQVSTPTPQIPTATGNSLSVTGKIAFVRNADIYVMKADGSGVTRLTNNPANDRQPAWSPDGTKIAFVSDRFDGNDEIYTMKADGSDVTRLTNNPSVDGAPAWSPDGTKIAFHSNRDGHFKVYVMKATGGGTTLLTKSLQSQCTHVTPICPAAKAPGWSTNGAKIAFIFRFGDFGATSLDVVNADGSGVTPLTYAGLGQRLSWSRTGKIAFDRYSGGNNEIFLVKADGTGLSQLTHNAASDLAPSWSPDGTRIAFESNRDGVFEIYAMNADGSGVTRLTHAGGLDPAWGP